MSDMKILVLDIETSPNLCYAWDSQLWSGHIPMDFIVEPTYMMSWAAKWVGGARVTYRDCGAPDFLDTIWKMINEADAVVHFNGNRFDMKHLNREFIEAGMMPPSIPHNIDLYTVVKKHFKFPSNKLDYVSQRILKEGKVKTGGSWSLWLACLNDEAWAWKKMKEYNIGDVELTERLYLKLRGWITNHPNHGLYIEDQENPVCRNCGSEHVVAKGCEYTTTGVLAYQRYKCRGCGANLRGREAVKGKRKASRQVLK
jgi:hypothetical protein